MAVSTSQGEAPTSFRPLLKPSLCYVLFSYLPQELLFSPVIDTEPSTQKVPRNSLMNEWMSGQLLEEYRLRIHFLEKGMGYT